ncbi:MAG: putative manganese transporter [Pseudomonadota bacterium]
MRIDLAKDQDRLPGFPQAPTAAPGVGQTLAPRHRNSLALAGCIIALAVIDPALFQLVLHSLADVYLGVSAFIALTLTIFYLLQQRSGSWLNGVMRKGTPWEVPVSALLGALPGCGGAIVVVTRFVGGNSSFGALVAVLTATMGDAAFLLMAREPQTAFLVYGTALLAGTLTGILVNATHVHGARANRRAPERSPEVTPGPLPSSLTAVFMLMLFPGAVFALANALQIDANSWFGAFAPFEPVTWYGFAGTLVCLAIWLSQPLDSWTARLRRCIRTEAVPDLVAAETSFVSVWVVLGFLSFELLMHYTSVDLAALFRGLGPMVILLATAVGLIPGCGPQIIMTTLYLNGVAPLSAQLANAISNDGDALFPALALAPRAAALATVYSAVPALLLGYLVFWVE